LPVAVSRKRRSDRIYRQTFNIVKGCVKNRPLGVQGIEVLLKPFLGAFTGVDSAVSDPMCGELQILARGDGRATLAILPEYRSTVVMREHLTSGF
jgi:hypothetical protein